MAEPIITLSPQDVRVLKDLVGWWRGQRGRVRQDKALVDDIAPEVYVARTPRGGIPASVINFTATGTGTGSDLEEGPLGHADCVIYRLDTDGVPKLLSQRYTKTVYNISKTAIPKFSIVQVNRDKYGRWIAVPPVEAVIGAAMEDPRPSFRYFCVGGELKEYLIKSGAVNLTGTGTTPNELSYVYVRDTGVLCGCCGKPVSIGTGTGTEQNPGTRCCDLQDNLCVTLSSSCCAGSCTINIKRVPAVDNNLWKLADLNNACGFTQGEMVRLHNPDGTCSYYLWFRRYVGVVGCNPAVTYCGTFVEGVATSITCSPIAIHFPSMGGTQWQMSNCQLPAPSSCNASAVVQAGPCAGGGSGGSGAGCPCAWRCHNLIWTEQTGNPACINTPLFAQGLPCNLDNEGQIEYTNTDGTHCAGTGGVSTCHNCTSNGTVSVSGTASLAVCSATDGILYCLTESGVWTGGISCGGCVMNFTIDCIDGVWWCSITGCDTSAQGSGTGTVTFTFSDVTTNCGVGSLTITATLP